MSKVFVVSDTWFNRPLNDDMNTSVVDNNDLLIENWNSAVSNEDDVYVLGGFGIADLYHILVQLNGKIHFLDNYYVDDEKSFITQMKQEMKNSINTELAGRVTFERKQILTLNKFDVVLSYFPLADWIGKESGTFCFHGLNETMNLLEHNISCVASNWENAPVDIEVVKNNITTFEDEL